MAHPANKVRLIFIQSCARDLQDGKNSSVGLVGITIFFVCCSTEIHIRLAHSSVIVKVDLGCSLHHVSL